MRKIVLIGVFFMAAVLALNAQTPYAWSFTAKKIADKTYEIHCMVDVTAPWHTYSQFTPDGGPLPTKFTFAKNPLYSLDGTIKEEGKQVTRHETVFGVDVIYFDGKVDFVRKIKLKGPARTNCTGSVEFMVCNEEQCLPPATKKFSVALQ
jgi:thiol:disulfide interchange protein DsbD